MKWALVNPRSRSLTRLLRTVRPYPVLAHHQFGQLVHRCLCNWFVQCDDTVLEQVYAVADLEDLSVVVCDHDDRYFAHGFQVAYEVQDKSSFLGSHCR